MKETHKKRLNNTSKMLLHWVQELRCAVKKDDELAALYNAREALNMASWVITYASSLASIKQSNRKEQNNA